MAFSKAVPQSALGVLGQVVTSMVVFGGVWAVIGAPHEDPFRIPQGVITGALAATINVALTYRRLPRRDRLAPLPAMGLALFNGALALWLSANGDPSVRRGVVVYLLLVALMAPPLYLFVSGLRQWRDEARAASQP